MASLTGAGPTDARIGRVRTVAARYPYAALLTAVVVTFVTEPAVQAPP